MVTTTNGDILGIVSRIDEYSRQMGMSQSAAGTGIREPDLVRLKAYQDRLKAYKAWIVNQPQLDSPTTHPSPTDVPDAVAYDIANNSLTDVIYMWQTLRAEMLNSQSSSHASGLYPPDAKRYDDTMVKLDAFIADYVEPETSLDTPEVAPAS